MEPKRLDERLGPNRIEDTSTASVQAMFRDRANLARFVEPISRSDGLLLIALVAIAVVVVWVMGYAIGGGFSPSETEAGITSREVFGNAQAEQLRQQAIDLQETRTELAVADGEAAFFRSQVAAISEDVERLQGSLNEARIEMTIIIGIYEECLDRLYPVECIESARPAAEAFLAELYAEKP